MQNTGKAFVVLLVMILCCGKIAAKGFQPRLFIADPEFYYDENYTGPDTVPVKAFVKANAFKSDAIKETQKVQNLQPSQKIQVVQPVSTTKKDTLLIKKLAATFKFKNNATLAERIKIKTLIDSVYKGVKDDPKTITGDTALDYQTLVRIIDSLLKANNRDSGKVIVDTPHVVKVDTPAVDIKEKENGSGPFAKRYWWLVAVVLLILAGLVFFILERKRNGDQGQPRIFFSYAWDQDEALIMQLYNSLKKDGFNVIKDKENIGYKGVISKFMNEIGSADFVIVAISDKYLRSRFCMYELYEIFRNSGMNSDRFGKKIFPIRIDESINLGDPDVVNEYATYWKTEEEEWTKRVKDQSDSITEEQARQFQFVKRLVIDISNILSCLADINSLNLATLKSNDFADVKLALRQEIEGKES